MVQVSVGIDTQKAVDDVRAYRGVNLSGVHLAEPVADELFYKQNLGLKLSSN
jgi:hypothetical protein